MDPGTGKKVRSGDFSLAEQVAIVNHVKRQWAVLNGGFSPSLTKEHKSRAWEQVTQACNAVSLVPRSTPQVSS